MLNLVDDFSLRMGPTAQSTVPLLAAWLEL